MKQYNPVNFKLELTDINNVNPCGSDYSAFFEQYRSLKSLLRYFPPMEYLKQQKKFKPSLCRVNIYQFTNGQWCYRENYKLVYTKEG